MKDDPKYIKDEVGGAFRADGAKLRYDLVPPLPLEDVARALTFGAEKYTEHNWANGMQWSRCYGSAMRHIQSWWQGEDVDPESGLNHLTHAICNLMFLRQYAEDQIELDNRPFKAKETK